MLLKPFQYKSLKVDWNIILLKDATDITLMYAFQNIYSNRPSVKLKIQKHHIQLWILL